MNTDDIGTVNHGVAYIVGRWHLNIWFSTLKLLWAHPKFRKKLKIFERLKLAVQDNNWSPMLYILTKLISKIKLFCRLLG